MSKGLKTAPFIGCNMEKDNLGNPVRVSSVARSNITSVTSGNFVVATTVTGKIIRAMNVDVYSNLTTSIQFSSGSATTITPRIAIAAGAPVTLSAEIFGQAPLKTAAGESIQMVIPADGLMVVGSRVTAMLRTVSTTD